MPIRPDLRALYRGPEYAAKRRAAFEAAGARYNAKGECIKGARCQHCDREDGTPYVSPRTGRWTITQLGRAHLNQDAYDDAPENIAVLCRSCHMKHDLAFHVQHARETRKTRKDAARPLLTEAHNDARI